MGSNAIFATCLLCTIAIINFHLGYGRPGTYLKELQRHNRVIRSPQFSFTGRNVLSDLTQQIKPPSLNDLTDFHQKIANLANFTALLEQALEAERTARSTLQNFVSKIKEQITGIQTAVNPDPENYWMESKECGGIVVSQIGKISYKANEYYKDNERCVWTIRANYRSKIKITLTTSGLEERHDHVSTTELLPKQGANPIEWSTKKLLAGQTTIVNGPLIFLTFVSDGSIRKKGFQVEFEGLGSNVNGKTIYQHFHSADWMGQFNTTDIRERLSTEGVVVEDGQDLIATFVVNPSHLNLSKLELAIPKSEINLNPDDCETTNLATFEEFAFREHGIAKMCCGSRCDQSKFESSNRVMLSILSSRKDSTDGNNNFRINWSTDAHVMAKLSEDTCGGVIKGDNGKISYKANVPYENNERCVWIVSSEKFEEAEIKFQLLKDGFEQHYDYVTLSYFKENGRDNDISTQSLFKASSPIVVPASFVFIQFYSDAANLGRAVGFELMWEVKYTTGRSVPVEFDFSNEMNGSGGLSCEMREDTLHDETVLKFNIIKPHIKDNESSSIILEPKSAKELTVFTSEAGTFAKVEMINSEYYQSKDGILLVKSECRPGFSEGIGIGGDGFLVWRTDTTEGEAPVGSEINPTKSVDSCGEVLHGDLGKISYKLGVEYKLNERCTWVIRGKSRSTISIRLMADGFESCCDGIQINRVDTTKGLIDPEAIFINRENRFQTLEGPVLLVTFFSDHSVVGTGFSLEFQTKGKNLVEDISVNHRHVEVNSLPFGPFPIQLEQDSMTINFFQLERNETSVFLNIDNLETNDCMQDSVALYHMPEISKYQMLKHHPDEKICPLNGPISETASTVVYQQERVTFKGALLLVAKIMNASADKSLAVSFPG